MITTSRGTEVGISTVPSRSGRIADDLERVLRGLEEAKEFARTDRFEMTDDYRTPIERVESMPRNQSGADRSGRWIGSLADSKAFRARVTSAPKK